MILDEKAKLVDYINCKQWFDTKFYLRSKPGTEIVIYISVLLEDVDFVNLMLSDEISCNETIFKILNQFRYILFTNSDRLPIFLCIFLVQVKIVKISTFKKKCLKRITQEDLVGMRKLSKCYKNGNKSELIHFASDSN